MIGKKKSWIHLEIKSAQKFLVLYYIDAFSLSKNENGKPANTFQLLLSTKHYHRSQQLSWELSSEYSRMHYDLLFYT